MSDNLRPNPDVFERVKAVLYEKGAYCGVCDFGPVPCSECDECLTGYARALAAAGLLIPSDTFASTKPSDAGHLLSVVETIKETGGSVQVHGVLITPCDTYGQPLTNLRPGADVAERIAEAWDEGYQAHEDEYWCGDGENPYRATPPEIPGFEGTRSALDGLTIRKEKTSD